MFSHNNNGGFGQDDFLGPGIYGADDYELIDDEPVLLRREALVFDARTGEARLVRILGAKKFDEFDRPYRPQDKSGRSYHYRHILTPETGFLCFDPFNTHPERWCRLGSDGFIPPNVPDLFNYYRVVLCRDCFKRNKVNLFFKTFFPWFFGDLEVF